MVTRRAPGGALNTVPLSVALVAGGLAVVNPCGFPLLPAFVSYYLGSDEGRLPRASTRIAQSLLVGALVTVGFLGVFAVASLPVSFGVALVARAVPWAGLATGALLAAAGLWVVIGRRIPSPLRLRFRPRPGRRAGAMVLFGVGYGAASLGCTLPLFLTLIAATSGPDKVSVFVAYAVGTAVVLMALSVLVAIAREGLVRSMRRLLPYMSRIAGVLLVVSGGYLVYYWARFRFGDTATIADDPVISFTIRFSAHIRVFAEGRGDLLVAAAGAIVTIALLAVILRWRRSVGATKAVSG